MYEQLGKAVGDSQLVQLGVVYGHSRLGCQRLEKFQVLLRERRCAASLVHDVDHAEGFVFNLERYTDQRLDLFLPIQSKIKALEPRIKVALVDQQGAAQFYHVPGNALPDLESHPPLERLLTQPPDHLEHQLVGLVIEKHERAPFGVQRLDGLVQDQVEKLVQIVDEIHGHAHVVQKLDVTGHLVERFGQLPDLVPGIHRDPTAEIAHRHRLGAVDQRGYRAY